MNRTDERPYFAGPVPPGSPSTLPILSPRWLTLSGGRKLFYLTGGNPDGPPALLLHGVEGWGEQWHPVLPSLSDHRWIIPDVPGFGRSDAPTAKTADAIVDDLSTLCRVEKIEHGTLLANSLGGGLALRLLLHAPEVANQAIIITAAGLLRHLPLPFRIAVLPGLGEWLLSHRPSVLKVRWHAQVGRRGVFDDHFLEQVGVFSKLHDCRPTYLGLVRSSVNMFGLTDVLTEDLPRIQQPILLAWGDRDRVIPLTHGQFAARTLPNARLEVFEGCGHYPHWEQPERFRQLLQQFLLRCSLRACA